MVSVIVVAGGYATRLRPLSLTIPKALIPLVGKPILDHILEGLNTISSQVSSVYVSARVNAERIMSHYQGKGLSIVIEETPLGDGGPLGFIARRERLDDEVLVVYGDIYNEVDYRGLLETHRRMGCEATLVGTRVKDPTRYGVLVTEDGILRNIVEKPSQSFSDLINAGIYVFNREELLKIQGKRSIAKDIIPSIMREGCVAVHQYTGIWGDIGVPEDYMRLNGELLMKKYPKGFVEEGAEVKESATLREPYYVGKGTRVGSETEVDSLTIIGEGCRIGEVVYIKGSVVMDRVVINSGTYVNGSIIAHRSVLGRWNHLEKGTILGEEVITEDGVMMNSKTVVLPYKEVKGSVTKPDTIIM